MIPLDAYEVGVGKGEAALTVAGAPVIGPVSVTICIVGAGGVLDAGVEEGALQAVTNEPRAIAIRQAAF